MKITAPPPLAPGWPPTSYRIPDTNPAPASAVPSTLAQATFLPFIIPSATRILRIGFYLVTAQAGAKCRLGLYADSGGAPGALIVDGGEIDLSAGAGAIVEVPIDVTLGPQLIWSCCQLKNVATQVTVIRASTSSSPLIPVTAAMLSGTSLGRYYLQSITYGSALPTPAGAVTPANGVDAPLVVLRSN